MPIGSVTLMRTHLLGLVLIVAGLSVGLSGSQAPAAASDIETLVRLVLESPQDIPDIGMLSKADPIPVLSDYEDHRLTARALPAAAPRRFELVSQADLVVRADATRAKQFYVFVRVRLNDAIATVTSGVDFQRPKGPMEMRSCCCSSTVESRKVDMHWQKGRALESHCL